MSRKFRSDDTDPWPYKFGSGKDGNLTVSSTQTHACANAGCSGTLGLTAITLDSASSFSDGDLVLIHQTQGTGVGEYEYNRIASGAGTTNLVMAHPLQNTYTDPHTTGTNQAQIVEIKEFQNVTINGGVTYSPSAWNGNIGGILIFFCNGTFTNNGIGSLSGLGFQGGNGIGGSSGNYSGEGTAGPAVVNGAANGSGGGQGEGGAGGGYGAAGGPGLGASGPGQAGAAVGNAGMTLADLGGAGGAGASANEANGDGGNSAALGMIFAVIFTNNGTLPAAGSNGENAPGANSGGSGGGGSGGGWLFKFITGTLGSATITAPGGAGGTSSNDRDGGAGAVGRIHADYASTISGTTSPSLDSRQDQSLLTAGGAMVAF